MMIGYGEIICIITIDLCLFSSIVENHPVLTWYVVRTYQVLCKTENTTCYSDRFQIDSDRLEKIWFHS